ncbi:MAG: hypothetical protein M3P82_03730, partial [Bacteroidota bacterium]|nr:hypothetical protein [Bacteroidota bacterium]
LRKRIFKFVFEKVQITMCDRCYKNKKTFFARYFQNVSMLVKREEKIIDGNFCFPCNLILFAQFTGITVVGTWWGIIGTILGPFYILLMYFGLYLIP